VCLGENAETGSWEEMAVDPVPTNYERFAAAVKAGVNDQPDFRHATNLQKVLDLATMTDRERREMATA
jgi:predicted dehydrogenase